MVSFFVAQASLDIAINRLNQSSINVVGLAHYYWRTTAVSFINSLQIHFKLSKHLPHLGWGDEVACWSTKAGI